MENARRRKGTTNFALLQVDIPIESSPEQATQPQSSQTNLTAYVTPYFSPPRHQSLFSFFPIFFKNVHLTHTTSHIDITFL